VYNSTFTINMSEKTLVKLERETTRLEEELKICQESESTSVVCERFDI